MASKPDVFFIVDANKEIGAGHLKRSILIANSFKSKGCTSHFFINTVSDLVMGYLNAGGYSFSQVTKDRFDPNTYLSYLKENDNLVVIDSDHDSYYDETFQKGIMSAAFLMFISVKNSPKYFSHFLVNQNIIALETAYQTESYTKTFLGPSYFILEEKYGQIKSKPTSNLAKPLSAMVTFGSSDPGNLTTKLMDELFDLMDEFDEIIIVLGGLNNKVKEIKKHKLLVKYANKIKVLCNVRNMFEIMENIDIAFTSIGLTYWELVLHEIPCFIFSGSNREKDMIYYFEKENFGIKIGDYNEQIVHSQWSKIIKKALVNNKLEELKVKTLKNKVNVHGSDKLVTEILHFFSVNDVHLIEQ